MDAPHSLPPSRLDALHELFGLDRLAAMGVDLGAVAFTDGTESLTWTEAHDAVARLSGSIADLGASPGDRVAVHLRKSIWSFVAVHAIIRAGAVMVPLDPLAPPGVARGVLVEADATVLITDAPARAVPDLVAAGSVIGVIRRGTAVEMADDVRAVSWDDALLHDASPPAAVSPGDAAYIIFTSGSTGRPKGIVHTHASAIAYAERAIATYGIGPSDVLANIASLHFDQSTFELYAGPLAGAGVVVIPDAVLRFPASATELIERAGVTVVYTVPHVLRQFAERGALDQRELSAVRWIKFGGEVYPPGELASLMAAIPSARASNVYGPAEVNQCTYHHLDSAPTAPVPIGRPWYATHVLVCDDDGAEVPAGAVGELWVATPTMMAGYWRQPELTARSIVERAGRRWYRTGDLVTSIDGLLEFKGRDDHQVKIRGQRVELEAVEAAISDLPDVVDVGVVSLPSDEFDGSVELVAAVIGESGADLGAMRSAAARLLGAAAVPARFVRVERLARTGNGKIDRAAVREALLNGAVDVPLTARPTD